MELKTCHLIRSAIVAWIALGLAPVLAAEEKDGDPFARLRDEKEERTTAQPAPPKGMETITRNLRWGVELMGRPTAHLELKTIGLTGGLGAEAYTQIVTAAGTWGTAGLQLRLMWDENRRPSFEAHDIYLEKRFLFGRLNLVAGHFRLPFGLEALPIDTHTTLIQLSNRQVLGFKHDWGVGLRGQLPEVDYHLTWTMGSGMDPALGAAGLFTARVGWPKVGVGVSWTAGQRLEERTGGRPTPVPGWRAGFDVRRQLGPLEILAETSAGVDRRQLALSALARLAAETPGGLLKGAAQYAMAQVPGPDGPHRIQQAGLEAAVRLAFITRQSYLRIYPTAEEESGRWRFVIMGLFYLRFDT